MSDTTTEATEAITEAITAEQRDEWVRLEAEATPGPWHVLLPTEEGKAIILVRLPPLRPPYPIASLYLYAKDAQTAEADAAFIAAARVAVPALLAEVERLEARADCAQRNYENALTEIHELRAAKRELMRQGRMVERTRTE